MIFSDRDYWLRMANEKRESRRRWTIFASTFVGVISLVLLVWSIRVVSSSWSPKCLYKTAWYDIMDGAGAAHGRESFDIVRRGEGKGLDSIPSGEYRNLINIFMNCKNDRVKQAVKETIFSEDDTDTYTDNKKEIFMCLGDRSNTLEQKAFVLAHEFAHKISIAHDPDHKTAEFKNNFDLVLDSITTDEFKPVPPISHCMNVPSKMMRDYMRENNITQNDLRDDPSIKKKIKEKFLTDPNSKN